VTQKPPTPRLFIIGGTAIDAERWMSSHSVGWPTRAISDIEELAGHHGGVAYLLPSFTRRPGKEQRRFLSLLEHNKTEILRTEEHLQDWIGRARELGWSA
jgi:hypothetical protein